ncbi:MAG TPA: hypothetical protein PKI11_11105 [Candidatus Hydrogenedentes bacterium]|nr:hypothetical protein [Candidatus Hydrogenedentota bacterium]HNT86399.1 hypothetical protein [Candidatus Hydrogenedentota bacterium]
MSRRAGYILFETVVAMGILSISLIVVYNGMNQALFLRSRAQDFTTARFLLQEVMAKRELELEMQPGSGQGTFEGEDARFQYRWEVSKVPVPVPPLPPALTEEERERFFKMFKKYMGKITVVVSWSRRGLDYEIKGETLIPPERLWLPEEERDA